MLFDTHTHLCASQFDNDREATIQRAVTAGVDLCLEAGTSIEFSRRAVALAQAHEANIVAAAGIHPHDAKDAPQDFITELQVLLNQPVCVAVGEIGLDYHYDFSPRDIQKTVLDTQLSLAAQMKLPVIIHDREAHADILAMLTRYKGQIIGVMHCYSGSVEDADKYLDMGFYISLGGPVTFKNARRPREVAAYVPIDRLLCETDCPYLTPVPHRGKRNEPMYVRHVVEQIARIRGVSYEEMAQTTMQNGRRLFGLNGGK